MKPNNFTIYIAEDNPQYLELIGMRLRKEQTEVRCFPHYAPLLEALSERPDLVVIDYRFGDQAEGLNLLAQIKATDPNIHVILISAERRVEVALQALKSGASDYFEKTGEEFDALESSVDRIRQMEIEKRRQRHGLRRLSRGFRFFRKGWRQTSLLLPLVLLLNLGCTAIKHKRNTRKIVPAALKKHRPNLITTDDKISLSIWNNDDLSIGSVFGIYNSNEVYGKWVLVDEYGNVSLPMLGQVHLSGLSTTEAADTLRKAYGEEVRDPVVVVKVLNREVTVTGEVNEPGNYILDKEKNTLAEVLGKAEGVTDYAKLKKVTLTRTFRGKTRVYPLDLRKIPPQELSQILVRRGDVINIPEKAGKKVEKKLPLLIPLATVATSVGILISVTQNGN